MSELAEIQSCVALILLNLEDVQKKLSKFADNQALILQNTTHTREAISASQLNSSQSDSTTATVPPPEPLREEPQQSSLSSASQPDKQTSNLPTQQPEREESQYRLPACQPSEGAREDSVNVNAELSNGNDQPLVLESESPSRWLEQTKPLKSPYYPQVGDKVVYFKQGHQLYFDAVRSGDMYQVYPGDEPWTNINLDAQEFCSVEKVSYELLSSRGKPLRLCSLLLTSERSLGRFTVRYHDLDGVVDFLILRSLYDKACSPTRRWEVGSRFRCAIEDSWQFGRVVNLKCPLDPERYPDSIFKSMRIKWDDGEELVEVSPWELEPVDDKRLPIEGSSMPILPDDVQDFMYNPTDEDWLTGRKADCRRILHFFDCLLDVPIVKPFEELINNAEPNYLAVVSYPIDLATVCARLRNNFYRRPKALLFDLEQLAANIAKVVELPIKLHGLSNRMSRDLRMGDKYKQIGQILFMIVNGELEENIECAIEQLQYFPESQESELAPGDNEGDYEPSDCTQTDDRSVSTQATNNIIAGANWLMACQRLFNKLWDHEAAEPFKHSNNEDSMNLQFVSEYLPLGHYKTPVQFANDVKNVLRIHDENDLTTRNEVQAKILRSLFDPQMVEIIVAWRENKNSGIARRKRKSNKLQQNVDDTGDSDIISPSKKHKNSINRGAGTSGNYKRNFVQDDSEHEKSESENDYNSDLVPPYRSRSRTSKNDDDESDPQMDDENSTECYSSSTTSESDDPYEEEDDDGEESDNQIPLAESMRSSKKKNKSSKNQQNKVGRPRKRLGTIDPSIKLTSSCDIMKYKPGNSVYITGVVSYVNLIEDQYSAAYKQEYEILEFIITNGDEKFVYCKAWETEISKIENKIKKNNVIHIAMASAIYPSRFNKGNIQYYELLIKKETKIEVLGRKRS